MVYRFIEGKTISNCSVKAKLLPVLHVNKLKGRGKIKAKRGPAKFKNAFEQLGRELVSLALTDDTNTNDIIHSKSKISDDYNCLVIFYNEESENRMELDSKNDKPNDKLDKNTDSKLIRISLTKAKEYVNVLHHFVADNMGLFGV